MRVKHWTKRIKLIYPYGSLVILIGALGGAVKALGRQCHSELDSGFINDNQIDSFCAKHRMMVLSPSPEMSGAIPYTYIEEPDV